MLRYALMLFMAATVALPHVSSVLADYELPQTLFGYKMVLASKPRADEDKTYIGFVQYTNMTPPFVIVVTKSFNMVQSKITTKVVDDALVGRIYLPQGVVAEDVKELRINGYSILWKTAE